MNKFKAVVCVLIGVVFMLGVWAYTGTTPAPANNENEIEVKLRDLETKLSDEIRHLQKQLNEVRNLTLDNSIKLRDQVERP